jgi:hypothetical protein
MSQATRFSRLWLFISWYHYIAAGMEEPAGFAAPVDYGGRKEACVLPVSPAADTLGGGAA